MGKESAFGGESEYKNFALLGQQIGQNRDKKALKAQINFLTGDNIIDYQRAASVLHHVSNIAPNMFVQHLDTLLEVIREHKHDSGPRVSFRIFMLVKIPEKFKGIIIDLAFQYLNDPKITVAIKVYAMNIIATQAKNYPELIQELKMSITSQLVHQSPAFKSCVKKLSKRLKFDLTH